jgi:hypothetical protein
MKEDIGKCGEWNRTWSSANLIAVPHRANRDVDGLDTKIDTLSEKGMVFLFMGGMDSDLPYLVDIFGKNSGLE